MSRREDYETKTEELLKPIAEANSVSIYDVEYVKEGSDYYLRAYIDKAEGVNIQDCENVSRALSDALDKADFIIGIDFILCPFYKRSINIFICIIKSNLIRTCNSSNNIIDTIIRESLFVNKHIC